MARLKIDYGIDLGTTNSAISRIDNGIADILEIDRSRTVPSAVSYDRRGRVRVGITALPTDPYVEFKRDMGQGKLTSYPDAKLSDGTLITPETLSSEVLKKLSERVNDEVFKSVVVTVPAMFEIGQIEATKRAAKMAGFEQVEILMEPVAAATAYAVNNIGKDGLWVVFDFGGGTFDASIVKCEEGVMKVTASEGDNRLGGGDLDRAIINNIMLPKIKEDFNLEGLDENTLKGLNRSLKAVGDDIKIKLSFNEEVDYLSDLGQFGNDKDGNEIELEYNFTREETYDHFKPYFQKSIDCVKRLIERNKLSTNDIDSLILVGGPTQIPLLKSMLEEQLMKPDDSLNPMTAVAQGAAIYASNVNNNIKNHGDKLGEDGKLEEVELEEIEVLYESNTVNDTEPVSLIKKDKNKKLFAIVKSSDGGWESPKQELDDVFELNIKDGVNNFKIEVYNEKSDLIRCNVDQINITKGITTPETSLPYAIGISIVDTVRKREVFRSIAGLEVDMPLPAVGLTKPTGDLFTMNDIRPGIVDDKLSIKLYQGASDSEGTRSKLNKFSGLEFNITGADVQKLIPVDSLVYFTLNIDRSQNVSLEAEFPDLDIIINKDEIEIPAQDGVTKESVNDLLKEANTIIDDLSDSFPIPKRLDELKKKRDHIKKNWEDNKDAEQSFSNLQELVIELDKEIDNLEWPRIQDQIKKSLSELTSLVEECVSKKLKGHEQDKSDLDSLQSNFEQLNQSPNIELGQSLLNDINGKIYQITDRHAGKAQSIAFIKNINQNFSSVKWKNMSEAKTEVDRGMQMVNSGASESELKQQLARIFSQMSDPNDIGGGGGLKG